MRITLCASFPISALLLRIRCSLTSTSTALRFSSRLDLGKLSHIVRILIAMLKGLVPLLCMVVFLWAENLRGSQDQDFGWRGSRAKFRETYLEYFKDSPQPAVFLHPGDPVWDELEIPHLIKMLDRTRLLTGSIEFERLMQPTTDISLVKIRRDTIQRLQQSQDLEVLRVQLESFRAKHETNFVFLMKTPDRPIFGSMWTLIMRGILWGQNYTGKQIDDIMASYSINWFVNLEILADITVGIPMIDFAFRTKTMVTGAANRAVLAQVPMFLLASVVAAVMHPLQAGWAGVCFANFAALRAVGFYFGAQEIAGTFSKFAAADDFVLKMSDGFLALQEIQHTVAGILGEEFSVSEFGHLFATFDAEFHNDAKMQEAQERMVSRNGARNTASELYHITGAPKTFDLLRGAAKTLVLGLRAIALVDAYAGMAALIKEYENLGRPMTPVDFITARAPTYVFEGIINPVLANARPNDFELGREFQHVVLTGPHAGGKSTAFKTIVYGHITGQTFGYAAARKASLASINRVMTAINVGDSLADGESGHTNEQMRIEQLNAAIAAMGPDDRMLMVVDDHYSKTIHTSAERRLKKFVLAASAAPGLGLLVATQFQTPSQVEAETNGRVRNFQPEVNETSMGVFNRTFRIIPGPATWWFEDGEKQDRFIDFVDAQARLQRAQRVCSVSGTCK